MEREGEVRDQDDEIRRADRARTGTPFLTTEQASLYLSLSVRMLQVFRSKGGGPLFRRHSRYVLYHIDDLDTWSKANAGGGHG